MSALEQQQPGPAESGAGHMSTSTSTSASTSDTSSADEAERAEEENHHHHPPMNRPSVASPSPPDLPEARKHTYLPGASHPLYPEEWIGCGGGGGGGSGSISSPQLSSCRREQVNGTTSSGMLIPDLSLSRDGECYDPIVPNVPQTTITELPILELEDVILFPGCTVPLRLRHPGWVEYLGTRIDEARLGVGHSCGGSSSGSEVRIGVLMKMRETRRRNRARRQRPQPPAQAVGGLQGNGAAAAPGPAGGGDGRGRRGRWRTELLRRGIRRAREPEQGAAQRTGGDGDAAEGDDRPRQGEGGEGDEGGGRPPPRPPPAVPAPPPDPLVGRVGTMAIITYTHEVAAGDGEEQDNSDDHPPPNASNRSSRVWLRHSGYLVMTALGTSRFRILSRIDSSTWDAENRVHPGLHRGDMADIKLYAVELLVDENLPLPPVSLRRHVIPYCEQITSIHKDDNGEVTNEATDGTGVLRSSECTFTNKVQKNLAHCSPVPSFAYDMVWPWRLVHKICTELSEIPAWEGLRNSLPPSSGLVKEEKESNSASNIWFLSNMVDPLSFSFWMASNMPLPAYDRLDLLEMDCIVQRLRYILSKVAQQRQLEKPIRCKQCGEAISTISDMFSVGGAEGTTGAYVNEYGIVHQTITVRKCAARSVFCIGSRETKDSWFPGYTWTIMHCALCQQHLGWKFDLLRQFRRGRQRDEADLEGGSQQQQQESESLDRPRQFFGLSGGSVTTEESLRPRRINAEDVARRRLLFELMRQAAEQGGDSDEDNDEDDDGGDIEESVSADNTSEDDVEDNV